MMRALLTNIQAFAKIRPTKHIWKEPYFDKKWGRDAAFKKTVDKEIYASNAGDYGTGIQEQILVRLKTPHVSRKENLFLSKMINESAQFVQEQVEKESAEKHDELLRNSSVVAMVEHFFEILKLYSIELNSCLGSGLLHLASTNPQTVTEIVRFNQLRQAEETISYHRARLSTSSYSLVLRGDRNGILFFIIPVARAMGLSKQECHFLPVMRLSLQVENGKVVWLTENGTLFVPKMCEPICISLFELLIKTSRDEIQQQAAIYESTAC